MDSFTIKRWDREVVPKRRCQSTLRNITEDQISHLHSDGILNHLITEKLTMPMFDQPIPVAARSKAYVCGRSHVGIAGSN